MTHGVRANAHLANTYCVPAWGSEVKEPPLTGVTGEATPPGTGAYGGSVRVGGGTTGVLGRGDPMEWAGSKGPEGGGRWQASPGMFWNRELVTLPWRRPWEEVVGDG